MPAAVVRLMMALPVAAVLCLSVVTATGQIWGTKRSVA